MFTGEVGLTQPGVINYIGDIMSENTNEDKIETLCYREAEKAVEELSDILRKLSDKWGASTELNGRIGLLNFLTIASFIIKFSYIIADASKSHYPNLTMDALRDKVVSDLMELVNEQKAIFKPIPIN